MWGSAGFLWWLQDEGVSTHPLWSTVGLQRKVSIDICSVSCSGYLQMPTQGLDCLGSGEEAIFNLKRDKLAVVVSLTLSSCSATLWKSLNILCLCLPLWNGDDIYMTGSDVRFNLLTSIIRWEALENHRILNEYVFAVEGRGLLPNPCLLCNEVQQCLNCYAISFVLMPQRLPGDNTKGIWVVLLPATLFLVFGDKSWK